VCASRRGAVVWSLGDRMWNAFDGCLTVMAARSCCSQYLALGHPNADKTRFFESTRVENRGGYLYSRTTMSSKAWAVGPSSDELPATPMNPVDKDGSRTSITSSPLT